MLWAGHSLRLAVSTFLLKWNFLGVLGIVKPSGKAFTYFPKTDFLCCKKSKAPNNCCNQLLLFQVIFSGIRESLWTSAPWRTTAWSHWTQLSYPDRAVAYPLSVWYHNSSRQDKRAARPAAPQNGGRGAPLRACSSGIATPPVPAAGGTHPCGTGPAVAASRASARDGGPRSTRGCPPATANTHDPSAPTAGGHSCRQPCKSAEGLYQAGTAPSWPLLHCSSPASPLQEWVEIPQLSNATHPVP